MSLPGAVSSVGRERRSWQGGFVSMESVLPTALTGEGSTGAEYRETRNFRCGLTESKRGGVVCPDCLETALLSVLCNCVF